MATDKNFTIKNGLTVGSTEIIDSSGNVDGRDVSADGTKLDNISTGADVTPSWVPSSNPGYITDYTVTQGDVTAHQAALSITESQISDLGSYITDYTVTQGDVTDHEAALSIATSQLTGNIDLTSQVTGTLPVSNMAATALTTVQTAASQSAQLALTAQEGDVVVRSDENKTYMHNGGSAGTMADYTLLATPTDSVTSVNGNTGAVTVTVPTATSDLTNDSGFITSADGGNADTLDGSHASAFAPAGGSANTDWNANKLIADAGANIVSNTINPFRWQRSATSETGQDDNVTVHIGDADINFTHNNDDDGDSSGYNFRYVSSGLAYDLLNFDASEITYKGHDMWHAGNDGSGSGLDADTVDGLQASSFLRSDQSDTMTGTLTIGAFSSADKFSFLNGGSAQGIRTNSVYAGVTYAADGSGSGEVDALNGYRVAGTQVIDGSRNLTNIGTLNGGTPWHSGNDGSGSGLDADTVDGLQPSSLSVSQANQVSGSAFGTTSSPSSVLEYQQASSQSDTKLAPSTEWHNTIRMGHGNPYSYYSNTLAMRMTGAGAGTIFTQVIANNSAQGWRTVWDSGNDGSGSGLDADTVDGVQASSMVQLTGEQDITGIKHFQSNSDTATATNSPLQAYAQANSNGAIMAFHRSSHYAVNMGLDSDNVFRIGGWSASSNRLQMDMSGNLTMAGNVTAYSDIRLKENINVIPDALDKVQQIRGVTFTRNDVDDLEQLHTGVIAQEVEDVLPMAVSEDNSGMKNVAYGNMVGLLIEAIKELTERVETLEKKLGE